MSPSSLSSYVPVEWSVAHRLVCRRDRTRVVRVAMRARPGEDGGDRLHPARAALPHIRKERLRGLRAAGQGSEMSDSLWEKLLVLAAFAVAVCFAVAGAHKVFFEHESLVARPEAAAVEATPPSSDVAAAVVSPETSARRSEAVAAAPTEADRHDCAAMRGTRLRTQGERRWYIDNCLFVARRAQQTAVAGGAAHGRAVPTVAAADEVRTLLRAAGFSLDEATPSRSALEYQATPPPWLSSHNAIGMAVDWMTSNSPVDLIVAPADCNAIWLNGHFVVTCPVGLGGCSGERCEAVLSFCVFSSEPLVVPDLSC